MKSKVIEFFNEHKGLLCLLSKVVVFVALFIGIGALLLIARSKHNAVYERLSKDALEKARTLDGQQYKIKFATDTSPPNKAFSVYKIQFEDMSGKQRFEWHFSSMHQSCAYFDFRELGLATNDIVQFTASEQPINDCGEEILPKSYINITRVGEDGV